MIVNPKGPLDDPQDSPPPYDDLEAPSRTFQSVDSKQGGAPSENPDVRSLPGPSSPAGLAKPSSSKNSWFSWFGEKESRKETKQTIQALIRDLVKDTDSPAASYVLQSCSDTCKARGLSFQSILSEKFIEGHCPIYWAIIKRSQKDDANRRLNEAIDLLDVLLSVPMNSTTRSEAYLACLLTSDQELFARLRTAETSNASAHELLLGDAPKDTIETIDGDPDFGAFRLVWNISQFQRRMRAIGSVSTEVVARGRLWSVAFVALNADLTTMGTYIKSGTWVASITLLSPSIPSNTYVQLSILDPNAHLPGDTTESPPSSPPPSQSRRLIPWAKQKKNSKYKPPITLNFTTRSKPLDPTPLWPANADVRQQVQTSNKSLIIPLDSHWNGHSLQFDGCSYLNSDGSLKVVLDGSLTQPPSEADCIIA